MDRTDIYERIKITAKGTKELNEIKEHLKIIPDETLVQIASAERTITGITFTFGEPDRNGFYNIPNRCTHSYEHGGNQHFSAPNYSLIIPKGNSMKFNILR